METKALILVISLMAILILILIGIIHNLLEPHYYDKQKRKEARLFIQSLKGKNITSLNQLLSNIGQVLFEQFNENPQYFTATTHCLELPDCNIWDKGTKIWIANSNWAYKINDKNGKEIPDVQPFNYYDRLLIDKIVELVRIQQRDVQIEIGLKKTEK
jgi:hypothetical protein